MNDVERLERWVGLLNSRKLADLIAECEVAPTLLERSGTAKLIQASALEGLGRQEEAGRAFDRAIELEPGNIVAHNNRAGCLERHGRFAEALAGYEAALRCDPSLAVVHVNRGRMLGQLDRWEEALQALDRAVALQPALAPAQLERGLALERLGRGSDAELAYRALLDATPEHELARLNLVKLLFRGRRLEECLAETERGLVMTPRSAKLHYWRGATQRVMGRTTEALAAMERCLALDPTDVGALCDKGQMLETRGRLEEAAAVFQAALALGPDHVTALNGVAATSWSLGQREAALETIDRALAIAPGSVNALLIRASFYQLLGRSSEAIADGRKAVELAPRDARGWHLLGDLMAERGNHAEALEYLSQASAVAPDEPAIDSAILWNLLHLPEATPHEVAERHRAWGRRFSRAVPEVTEPFTNRRDPDRRLRVGFVSRDLINHPVGRLLLGVLPSLDPGQLAVVGFNNNPEPDDITDAIRAGTSAWHDIWSMDDAELATLVRAEPVDILVDLSGHTKGNRLGCLALRPAPVQATLWGYPFSTGLPAMDFAIMDEAAVPAGMEDLFVERVIRLPGGRFRLRRPQVDLPVSMPPSMRRGRVTFGSFNNIAKLNERVFDVWASILREVPKSRLVLKWFNLGDPEVATRIRAAFADRGIAADRLELRGSSPHEKMLSEYADIDIALDPFPFSGGITSFEALWMGVPIVTLPGWQPVSRQTLGYLRAIGREGLAAADEDDYVGIAKRLAGDASLLTGWRFSQRFAVENSSICDFAGAARELQQLFRTMWKDYLSRS